MSPPATVSSSRTVWIIAVLLLSGYFIMAVSAAREEGPAFDEVAHLAAGYNIWFNHDFRFDPGNGDFVKRWATLPLLLTKPHFPPLSDQAYRDAEIFTVGHKFVFYSGNDPAGILLPCRAMVALLGVVLGVLVFVCARKLYGDAAGLLSLGLFVFCPHLLAHGALVTTDLALTLALLASTCFVWRLLHRITWFNLGGSLLALAVLLISKLTAVLIGPVAVVLIVVRCFNRTPWLWALGRKKALTTRSRQAVVLAALIFLHVLAGWITIWAAFDFRYLARADPADAGLILTRSPGGALPAQGLLARSLALCHAHHLLPEGYLQGWAGLASISQRRPSFMNGHWWVGGTPWFFPYAFWVKTPPAVFLLLGLGGVGAWGGWRRRAGGRALAVPALRQSAYEAIPLAVLFIVYAAAAVKQNVNIGHRHILMLYVVIYIFAGSAVFWWPQRRWVQVTTALLLGWFAFDSLAVRPHYLAYFNGLAGGPAHGYRHLVDSSLDWGQDLPGLKLWLSAHAPAGGEPVFFSYFGTGSPEFYGIESKRLPGFPDWRNLEVFACTPGCYALSATTFQNVYTHPFGPWNRACEDEYQAVLRRCGITEENSATTDALVAQLLQHPQSFWQEQYSKLEKLRFNRLCGWLRATHRAPDGNAGYSILIWKLNARDLHEALWGPPLELYAAPANTLPDGI